MFRTIVFVATSTALTLFSGLVSAADLNIQVTDIRNTKGHLLIAVDTNAEDFASSKGDFASLRIKINGKTDGVVLTDIPTGRYAISIMHDENDNMDLDTKGQIPTEGYGFSGVGGAYKAPKFQKAAIEVNEPRSNVTIKTIYLD